jgi:hypothetical protein
VEGVGANAIREMDFNFNKFNRTCSSYTQENCNSYTTRCKKILTSKLHIMASHPLEILVSFRLSGYSFF